MTKLPKVTWVSSDVVFSQTMAEKTEWEIENQRQGVVMWERCFKRLMETLIEGETLNTLISRLAAFAVEEGAFLAWTHPSEAWGWWRSPPWLSRPDIVHRGSVIRRNMMISLDFGLHLEGYYIDMARQFVLGRASPEAKRRAAVSAAVQALVAEKLRPGISCRDGYREIRSAMAREFPGVDVLIHGVGLKINDTPMIIVEGNRNSEATHPDDLRFYPGTIFCIEPSIPEDMYLMHRNGPERLSALPLDVIEV
jgi:Xaa-Pro aminopeptidase